MIRSPENLNYYTVSESQTNEHSAFHAVLQHRSYGVDFRQSFSDRVDAGVSALETAQEIINEAMINRLIAEIMFSAEDDV